LAKPKGKQGSDWVAVAELDQLPIGTPQEVLYKRRRVDGWRKVEETAGTWIVRTDEHNVIAYAPACTHLGCAYHWDASKKDFLCPCHASEFSIDGKVLAGPAPRPLDRYCSKIEEGRILIGSQIEKGVNA
ncbi:MAG: ubiquinol-cytochrome c reductase iron-sulfur subunit, partial [Edaphobacter sp.]